MNCLTQFKLIGNFYNICIVMHGSMKVKNNAGSFLSESTSNEFPYRNVNSRGFIAVVSWIMIGNTHEG